MTATQAKINTAIGTEETLAQLAEEAAELCHAALKLRRVMCGKNPTPVSLDSACDDLIEEFADVVVSMGATGIFTDNEYAKMLDVSEQKTKRWVARLGVTDDE